MPEYRAEYTIVRKDPTTLLTERYEFSAKGDEYARSIALNHKRILRYHTETDIIGVSLDRVSEISKDPLTRKETQRPTFPVGVQEGSQPLGTTTTHPSTLKCSYSLIPSYLALILASILLTDSLDSGVFRER